MITAWAAAVPSVVAAVALIAIPGLLITSFLGVRNILRWALAMPISLSIIVLASLIAPIIGLGWSWVPVVAVWLALSAIAVVARRIWRGRAIEPPVSVMRAWIVPGALAIGGAIILAQMIFLVGAPENFSQTFDNVFHLNAIRYVLDTQNASPLHVGSLTSAPGVEGQWFYPSGWHAFVALVAQLSGASIPLASNAAMIAAAAVAWPAGVTGLTMVVFGAATPVVIASGVFSAASAAFPLLLVDYGVLYPYFLALCVLPSTIAATMLALRVAPRAYVVTPAAVLLTLGALPGLAMAHPGALVAWLLTGIVAAAMAWVRVLRAPTSWRRRLSSTVGLALFTAASVVAWNALKPPVEARGWPITATTGQAIGEIVTLSMSDGAVSLLLAVMMWVGIVSSSRRATPAVISAFIMLAVFAGLYVTVTASHYPGLRDFLTGAWYNNAPRLAALVPLLAVPFASVGAAHVWAKLGGIRVQLSVRRGAGIGLAATAIVLLIVGTQATVMWPAVADASRDYRVTAEAALVSTDELALIEQLPDLVPANGVVAGNPWTGTALAYAFADRRVLMPHLLMAVSDDMALINDSLDRADGTPAVCEAVRATGVTHVLDFGDREVHGAEHPLPGLEDLSGSDSVDLVTEIGDAKLYVVTGCDG